jgi:hypothetical protein
MIFQGNEDENEQNDYTEDAARSLYALFSPNKIPYLIQRTGKQLQLSQARLGNTNSSGQIFSRHFVLTRHAEIGRANVLCHGDSIRFHKSRQNFVRTVWRSVGKFLA